MLDLETPAGAALAGAGLIGAVWAAQRTDSVPRARDPLVGADAACELASAGGRLPST